MKGALVISLIAAALAWYEVPRMWKRQGWRDMSAFGLILAGSTALCVCESYHMAMFNPLKWIEWACTSAESLFH